MRPEEEAARRPEEEEEAAAAAVEVDFAAEALHVKHVHI